jgi:prepilin-type processing-associated H-X9-DG protein
MQDNAGRYPGKDWHTAIEKYVEKRWYYHCPSDADDMYGRDRISYGYSGLLVRTDGSGCYEAQIKCPSDLGCIVDATPSQLWDDGGSLINGGALMNASSSPGRASVPDPRHDGLNVAFCDGHAEFIPGKRVNERNIRSRPMRAFYHAAGMGFVANYGGGLNDIPCKPTRSRLIIGGDAAGVSLLMAAADVWAAKGGKWYSRGFKGQTAPMTVDGRPARHYAWIDAGGGSTGTPVARDALLIIVSKNCKIPRFTANAAGEYVVTPADLVRLFGSASNPAAMQVYTYDAVNGNRRYFGGTLRAWGAAPGAEFGAGANTVVDDWAMVDAIADDPHGIGYCSSSAVDIERVQALTLNGARYPNQNPNTPWLVPTSPTYKPGAFEYPLIRTIRLRAKGDGARLAPLMCDPEFQHGPLFKGSYFTP